MEVMQPTDNGLWTFQSAKKEMREASQKAGKESSSNKTIHMEKGTYGK